MRKVIARRLTEAKQTIPHFYLTLDCELDALLAMRAQLNGRDGADYKLSVNDFVIKAVALAMRKVPGVNASWGGDKIYQYKDIDVSVAVAIDGGLITPIIRKADQKGLSTISNEMKDLAERAKDGKLKPEEFQGGGFSISNLGMFGIKDFLRRHQPAAGLHPGGGCRREAAGGQGRRDRDRDRDVGQPVDRPSRGRRGAGRPVPAGVQEAGRGPAGAAALSSGLAAIRPRPTERRA